MLIRKLKKFLSNSFKNFDTITVKDYYFKLFDLFGCIRFYQKYKDLKKRFFSYCLKNKKRKFVKPHSMKDVPDSCSDSSDDPKNTFKGLSDAAVYL